jgi:hypothetical protein
MITVHRIEKAIRHHMQLRQSVKIQQSLQHIVLHMCGADSEHDKQEQSQSRDLFQGLECGRDDRKPNGST